MPIYSELTYERSVQVLMNSPLMPIVHWPTFSQQLVAREDEKSETWRAFLLSLGTLLSFLGLTKADAQSPTRSYNSLGLL
jgi:hypothetical protein